MSGTPVAAPALSLHLARAVGSSTNSDVVPTMANEVRQASIVPLVESSGVILESHGLTTTLRQATPPALFWASPHALTASIEPWNRPGANGEPVSAMTKIVIES